MTQLRPRSPKHTRVLRTFNQKRKHCPSFSPRKITKSTKTDNGILLTDIFNFFCLFWDWIFLKIVKCLCRVDHQWYLFIYFCYISMGVKKLSSSEHQQRHRFIDITTFDSSHHTVADTLRRFKRLHSRKMIMLNCTLTTLWLNSKN